MATPHAVAIELSEADRAVLLGWSRRRKTAQALGLRARIVLACADSTATNTATNNINPEPFVWTKTADQILQSVAEFCIRTSGSHH